MKSQLVLAKCDGTGKLLCSRCTRNLAKPVPNSIKPMKPPIKQDGSCEFFWMVDEKFLGV